MGSCITPSLCHTYPQALAHPSLCCHFSSPCPLCPTRPTDSQANHLCIFRDPWEQPVGASVWWDASWEPSTLLHPDPSMQPCPRPKREMNPSNLPVPYLGLHRPLRSGLRKKAGFPLLFLPWRPSPFITSSFFQRWLLPLPRGRKGSGNRNQLIVRKHSQASFKNILSVTKRKEVSRTTIASARKSQGLAEETGLHGEAKVHVTARGSQSPCMPVGGAPRREDPGGGGRGLVLPSLHRQLPQPPTPTPVLSPSGWCLAQILTTLFWAEWTYPGLCQWLTLCPCQASLFKSQLFPQ